MLSPGDSLGGKYRIVRTLGVGGMGVVYEAVQQRIDRRVAIKVLNPVVGHSSRVRERFLREAKVLAHLSHPNIAQLYDIDALNDSELFMVLEFLDGRDLGRELDKRGPLPIGEAVGYVVQVARGLAAAHAAGVVHRDVKPQNLFITQLDGDRRVKLLDFGIAKVRSEVTMTNSQFALGTPTYMSPEQFSGDVVDARSDLWALGAVLYELVTGQAPFRRQGLAVMSAVLFEDPIPALELRPELPAELDRVITRCLAKDPDERYASADALRDDLTPFLPPEGVIRVPNGGDRGSSLRPIPLEPPASAEAAQNNLLLHPVPASSSSDVPVSRGSGLEQPQASATPGPESRLTVQPGAGFKANARVFVLGSIALSVLVAGIAAFVLSNNASPTRRSVGAASTSQTEAPRPSLSPASASSGAHAAMAPAESRPSTPDLPAPKSAPPQPHFPRKGAAPAAGDDVPLHL